MIQILILDDDVIELKGLKMLVEQECIEVDQIHFAANVEEAKNIVKNNSVDIALCDIELPKESGIDFAKWMVENKIDTDVIFVTGHAKFIYAVQAVQLHARSYLLKPISNTELRDNVTSCLEYREKLGRSSKRDAKTEEADTIQMVKQYIQEHLSEDISRNDIAKAVFLHPDYISSIFHKETGSTLTDYIMTERIECAKERLRCTRESISEVALNSGFSNTSYFSKIFKRAEGITPKQYRERN